MVIWKTRKGPNFYIIRQHYITNNFPIEFHTPTVLSTYGGRFEILNTNKDFFTTYYSILLGFSNTPFQMVRETPRKEKKNSSSVTFLNLDLAFFYSVVTKSLRTLLTGTKSCQSLEKRCEDLKLLRCLIRPSLRHEKHRSFLFSRLDLLKRTDP